MRLRDIAKGRGIKGYSKMKAAELRKVLGGVSGANIEAVRNVQRKLARVAKCERAAERTADNVYAKKMWHRVRTVTKSAAKVAASWGFNGPEAMVAFAQAKVA